MLILKLFEEQTDLTIAFPNMCVREKNHIFNKTILNTLSNFTSHEILTCEGKAPPWFNKTMKGIIQEKRKFKYFMFDHILIH